MSTKILPRPDIPRYGPKWLSATRDNQSTVIQYRESDFTSLANFTITREKGDEVPNIHSNNASTMTGGVSRADFTIVDRLLLGSTGRAAGAMATIRLSERPWTLLTIVLQFIGYFNVHNAVSCRVNS